MTTIKTPRIFQPRPYTLLSVTDKPPFAAKLLTGGLLALALSACGQSDQTPVELSLTVLSSAPHLVTGNSALVDIRFQPRDFRVPELSLNGQRVTPDADDVAILTDESANADSSPDVRIMRALVQGLALGENTLTASLHGSETQVTLVNYPISGPVISGPQQIPYVCLDALAPDSRGNARRFAIGNGEFLDTSNQADDCSLPGRVDYVYRAQGSEGFVPLNNQAEIPEDVISTTTSDGKEVPFVVRLETGTINRAIYQIAMLHNPASGEPSAVMPSDSWNGRLVYSYGGGCEAGYFQGSTTGGVLRESMLAQGYAVASSTLNVNAQGGCNDVLSAETTMMVKEHFTEQYGVPVHTIGTGGSGGAMQQLLIAGAYPGILDGLLVSMTFPDAVTYFTDSQECSGPWRQYANDPANALDDNTRTLLGGWPNWYLCDQSLGLRPDRISPFDCPAEIPAMMHYHPQTNPGGARCSIYDGMRNIFGEKLYSSINATRPFAPSPHDNIGVQYGLEALNLGLIEKSLFLDINEKFGGWDIDYQLAPARTEGDADAIRIAYETGRITNGTAGLARVPIIDDRPYLDHEGNFHASVYSFVTRARLERDNGHADNYVIRRHASNLSLADENLALMNRWLDAVKADDSPGPLLDRIAANRPAELADDCFDNNGERIVEPAVFDLASVLNKTQAGQSRCNALYPPHAGLRLVAGGPLTNDIMKCALKPIDYDDYRVEFTAEEKSRLEAIFPQGVCDWEQPGQYQNSNQTWLSFGPSPVNLYQEAP
ncbi:MAG: hypothetical protein KKD00_08980 [Gammaproteobacteria bacterium]|nr:hypothetical protein [Gammaproteobacteria bacterium]